MGNTCEWIDKIYYVTLALKNKDILVPLSQIIIKFVDRFAPLG